MLKVTEDEFIKAGREWLREESEKKKACRSRWRLNNIEGE